jgi:hypothetical protein
MSYSAAFTKKGLLKIALIAFSILIWMYFYTASHISLKALIIFDLPTIVNTFLTLDFLLLLLFFPITSSICIALSIGKDKQTDLIEVFIGMLAGFMLSFILFGFSLNFLLFAVFYLIAHLILSVLTYNKFKIRDNLFSLSNYANSKISLLLTVSLFLVILLVILPSQHGYAQKMQAGIVNVFIGDNLGEWLGTSYSIGKASTVSAVTFIIDAQEYEALKSIQDPVVYKYLDYMDDLKQNLSQKTTKDDIKKIYANLDSVEVKNQVLSAISNMPLMVIVNQFFALFYALIMASMAQIYFSISFSLFGLLYVYLFYKLFYKKEQTG